MKNPFNITYGMIPSSLVGRSEAYVKIMNAFLNEDTIASTYIITGIRGSGKTVLLRSIAKDIKAKKRLGHHQSEPARRPGFLFGGKHV